MPGRPGASGKDRPGLKKYRFLIKIIEKINGFESRGVRERAARSGRDWKSIDFLLKSIDFLLKSIDFVLNLSISY